MADIGQYQFPQGPASEGLGDIGREENANKKCVLLAGRVLEL